MSAPASSSVQIPSTEAASVGEFKITFRSAEEIEKADQASGAANSASAISLSALHSTDSAPAFLDPLPTPKEANSDVNHSANGVNDDDDKFRLLLDRFGM